VAPVILVPFECMCILPVPPELALWICTDVLPDWIRSNTALIPLLAATMPGGVKQRLYCRGGPIPEEDTDLLESRRATSIPTALIASAW
jgi:hypothetical protein